MKYLSDGERRTMKPDPWIPKNIQVIAERIDSDTPNVILKIVATGQEIYLSDIEAESIATRINRALSILPTSK